MEAFGFLKTKWFSLADQTIWVARAPAPSVHTYHMYLFSGQGVYVLFSIYHKIGILVCCGLWYIWRELRPPADYSAAIGSMATKLNTRSYGVFIANKSCQICAKSGLKFKLNRVKC
uniref:Uncharacterized protein n=1 Tax=Setaria viridis TaxID=4556 RepID=A0A4U6W5H7_SETVI|nr:hypothetical protein SEVIR_1G011750v2 [Setaria viridis]